MLAEFVESGKRSIGLANKIEAFISDHFEGDEALEELEVALACYRPEGGEFLFNERQMVERGRIALEALRERLAGS